MHAHLCGYMCVICMWRAEIGIFLPQSFFTSFIEERPSLNPELTQSVVQLANLSCLHIEVLVLQAGHLAIWLLMGSGD